MTSLPPCAIFFAAALVVPLVRGNLRAAFLLLVPLLGALNLWYVDEGLSLSVSMFTYTLTILRADTLSLLFGYLFHVGAFLAILYSLHVRDTGEHVVALLYAGSALGAVFAGDLLTLFVFWELMAITSVFLIWARRTPHALSAGFRFLIFQILSGYSTPFARACCFWTCSTIDM